MCKSQNFYSLDPKPVNFMIMGDLELPLKKKFQIGLNQSFKIKFRHKVLKSYMTELSFERKLTSITEFLFFFVKTENNLRLCM